MRSDTVEESEKAMARIDALYQRSEQLLNVLDKEGFVETYLEALDHQASALASASASVSVDGHFGLLCNSDVVVRVLMCLNGKDLYSALAVNRSWYKLARSGWIWQRIYNSKYRSNNKHIEVASGLGCSPTAYNTAPDSTSWLQHDWYRLCQQKAIKQEGDNKVITADARCCSKSRRVGPVKKRIIAPPAATEDSIYLGDVGDSTSWTWENDVKEYWPLAMDIGSYSSHMGHIRQDQGQGEGERGGQAAIPSIRTVVARRSYRHCHSIQIGMGQKDSYVGDEAIQMDGQFNITIEYPFVRGLPKNWDNYEKVLHHVFYNVLREAPEEHILVLTYSPMLSISDLEKLVQIAFETFSVPMLCLASRPLAAMHTAINTGDRKSSGVILHSGGDMTYCVPFYEGTLITDATKTLSLGGEDVRQMLEQSLLARCKAFESLGSKQRRLLTQSIVEQHAYVAKNYNNETAIVQRMEKCNWTVPNYREIDCLKVLPVELSDKIGRIVQAHDIRRTVKLESGTEIELTDARFACAEILFQPTLFKPNLSCRRNVDPSMCNLGVHELVHQAIAECNIEQQSALYNNIVLSGGNTLLPGFASRLETELRSLVEPARSSSAIRISALPGRDKLVWHGLRELAHNSEWMRQHGILKEQYDELGPTVASSVYHLNTLKC
eukprot:TRINITY_DN3926_c0_g1_i1.p1 TRINITY_DN3926_c0_g1~~TRINITY_DN3926_c0_g1_i1.p1  ORF type:complete len:665 (-),score=70.47 TRINITY_DN3926_c0_g1_i1:138-2132(-)